MDWETAWLVYQALSRTYHEFLCSIDQQPWETASESDPGTSIPSVDPFIASPLPLTIPSHHPFFSSFLPNPAPINGEPSLPIRPCVLPALLTPTPVQKSKSLADRLPKCGFHTRGLRTAWHRVPVLMALRRVGRVV